MGLVPHVVGQRAQRRKQLRKQLSELLGDRPGWRLEPQATPGAAPLWCYADEKGAEFSVAARDDEIVLCESTTDGEARFGDVEALTSWLRAHRPDALREPPTRLHGKARIRRFFEWS